MKDSERLELLKEIGGTKVGISRTSQQMANYRLLMPHQ
jgi:hypothetical protein